MLLIVLLPATNAPRPPMVGENAGQASPAMEETPLAKTSGIEFNPAAHPVELIKTCTIGTANTNATDAERIILPLRAVARPIAAGLIRCKTAVNRHPRS